jgi:hypothetical protein
MRGWVGGFVAAGLLVVACSSPAPPVGKPSCFLDADGCVCSLQPPSSSSVSSCDPSVVAQARCCADPGWPSSGGCDCLTAAIFCGVVPGYEPGTNGAPGQDACVCSVPDPRGGQTLGGTCYPNGTTTPGAGLGACCMFPPSAPGSLGGAACVCASGLHTCATGGVAVSSCSPTTAGFPAPTPGCRQAGSKLVAKCL